MEADPFDSSKLYEKYRQKAKEAEQAGDMDASMASDCESKVAAKFKLDSDTEEMMEEKKTPQVPGPKKYTGEDEWLNDRFSRLLLTTFHDGNVKLFDGEEYKQPNEVDMRNSMLFYLFMNMSCCYMNMNHFAEARVVLDEAEKLTPSANSLCLFRSAQCRAYTLDSSKKELQKAKEEIGQAREAKKTEKIFQHPVNLLKMLNLHNMDQALDELEMYVESRIKELSELRTARLERLVQRVAQINEIEQLIISEGKVPEEGPDIYNLFNDDPNMEFTIMANMLDKYLTVIDFYQETKEEKQVELAQKEFLAHKRVFEEFAFYWTLNAANTDGEMDEEFKSVLLKYG